MNRKGGGKKYYKAVYLMNRKGGGKKYYTLA
jgi:hypothetical protein